MASTDVITDTTTGTGTKVAMRPPSKFNVVLFNDDVTTVEFVIRVLMSIFQKSIEEASALTLRIHENGRGVAGTYSHELAAQKKDDTISAARTYGFPLRCEIQEV